VNTAHSSSSDTGRVTDRPETTACTDSVPAGVTRRMSAGAIQSGTSTVTFPVTG